MAGLCALKKRRIKRGARCADAGPMQRVPKNTPDASPRIKLSEDFLIRRTVPPEGFPVRWIVPSEDFLIRGPLRPKAS